jgi:hypothetical protein
MNDALDNLKNSIKDYFEVEEWTKTILINYHKKKE